jgi:PTS system ascorbate-specific IIC component
VLITFLPALLLKVLGAFGNENTTFGDADFGWFGSLIGNAAKAGETGGVILMLVIGAVILGGAILVQKRVVDTGWDPGARRDALLPRDAAPAGDATAPATGAGTSSYAKIAPPPGAPKPPPPPAAN